MRRRTVEVWCTVVAEGAEHDVWVTAPPDTPAGTVLHELARHVGTTATNARLAGTGEAVAPDMPWGRAWADGEILELSAGPGQRDRQRPSTDVQLVVVGGPAAGERVSLKPGSHVLGRTADADVALRDPSISRAHARLDVADDGTVRVDDLGSRNGTFLDGQAVKGAEPFEPGQIVEIGSTLLRIERAEPAPGGQDCVVDGRIPFNRPPRLAEPYRPPLVTLAAPPRPPTARRFAVGTALIPLALGAALFAITQSPASLLFALLSPAMAIYTVVDERRSGRRTYRDEVVAFRQRVAEAADLVRDERRRESAARRAAHPDLADVVARSVNRDDRLWERRPGDADFLEVRVGAADQPSAVEIQIAAGGSEELRAEATSAIGASEAIVSLPVILALRQRSPVGLVGPRDTTTALARALLAQLATLHAPGDLAISVATVEERRDQWAWCSWLPHVRGDQVGIGFPLLAATSAAVQELAGRLTDALDRRTAASPAVAAVVDSSDPGDLRRWAPMLDAGPATAAVVWIADRRRDLPNQCAAVMECGQGSARLTFADGGEVVDIIADGISVQAAHHLARSLAPLVEVAGRSSQSVPVEVGLDDVLQLGADPVDELVERWSRAPFAARAVVGRSAAGDLELDLGRDGPHALVAGTSGAGKSELLQSWVASLAAAYPPDRLTFLLIDFKGEAAFRVVSRLPHAVGVVTDLAPELARRALTSLNAELRRREELLRQGGASSVDELARTRPDLVPPRLIIVIDEFAVLKKELSSVLDGIIDLARRGRSLGLHLVLATQSPRGVVDDSIRDSANLRICLRVVDPTDSQDVIDAPDAARLSTNQNGRAFVRSGAGALTEVQIAFGGRRAADEAGGPAIQVGTLELGRRRTEVGADAPPDTGTELERIVDLARRAAERSGRAAPAPPWLPPLLTVVRLAELPGAEVRGAAVGLVDRPAAQRQDPLVVDLEADGNVAVFGAARSGKSTVLRTIAAALAATAAPSDVHLYGLDFGSGGLQGIEALPHTGSVVPGGEDERVRRLLRQLQNLVAERRRRFGEIGATTLDDLRSKDGRSEPRVVLLLDDYGAFAATYERVDLGEILDVVPRIVADGPAVGVHVVLTADRRGAIPTALHGTINRRIVLRLANPDEYNALGVDLRIASRDRGPGRAIIEGDAEAQIAVVGGADGASQVQGLAALGDDLRRRYPDAAVQGVTTLSATVALGGLPTPSTSLTVPFAIGDDRLESVDADLTESHLLVVGPHRSGRTTTLAVVAAQLADAPDAAELVLIAPRRSRLRDQVAFSRSASGDECQDLAAALAAEVELRRDDGSERPMVVLADDLEELFDTPASSSLERLARRGRDRNVRLVGACESRAAHRAFGGVVPELRKARRGILLVPDVELDGDLVGVRLPRRRVTGFGPGRGYLVDRGRVELVQVASPSVT